MELCLLDFEVGVVPLGFLMDTIFGLPATRAGSAVLYPGLLRTVEGDKTTLGLQSLQSLLALVSLLSSPSSFLLPGLWV